MKNYIEKVGLFYHATPASNIKRIQSGGLRYANKGICTLRTKNETIVNAMIASQIPEIKDGNEYGLIEFKLNTDDFPLDVYEPDVLYETDWTFPFHTTLKVPLISPDKITNITRHTYNADDGAKALNNKSDIQKEPLYLEALNIRYCLDYRITAKGDIQVIRRNSELAIVKQEFKQLLQGF